MTFQERAKITMEKLSKQRPVTAEEMIAQAKRVRARIDAENKKGIKKG